VKDTRDIRKVRKIKTAPVPLFGHKWGEILKSIEINTLGPGLGSGDGNSCLQKI
jgi:hypothetical protein